MNSLMRRLWHGMFGADKEFIAVCVCVGGGTPKKPTDLRGKVYAWLVDTIFLFRFSCCWLTLHEKHITLLYTTLHNSVDYKQTAVWTPALSSSCTVGLYHNTAQALGYNNMLWRGVAVNADIISSDPPLMYSWYIYILYHLGSVPSSGSSASYWTASTMVPAALCTMTNMCLANTANFGVVGAFCGLIPLARRWSDSVATAGN